MSEKQKRRVVHVDEGSRIQRVRNEMLMQPGQEDRERAAKVVIRADEQEHAALVQGETVREVNPEQEPGSFYREKQRIANRRQEVRDRHAAQDEPPSVIAFPEQLQDDLEWDVDDLDSLSQTIPLVIARLVEEQSKGVAAQVLDERFEKLMGMLVKMQKQQYDAFAKDRSSDTEPTASLTSTSDDTSRDLASSTGRTARVGADPPASVQTDHESMEQERKSASRPDPPAMQLLIGDMLEKLDPSGERQTNDLSNFVLERLAPATRRGQQRLATSGRQNVESSELDRKLPARPTKPPSTSQSSEEQKAMTWMAAMGFDSSEHDRKLPAQPAAQDVVIENFDRQWESAERRVRAAMGEKDANSKAVGPVATPSVAASKLSGKPREPPQEAQDFPEVAQCNMNDIRQPGAVRAAPAGKSTSGDEDSIEITEEETKPEALDAVTAHVVDDDEEMDRDLQLKKLTEAVASLQKQQSQVLEARIVRASEVIAEEEDDDDDEGVNFVETYGYTIALVGMAFVIGVWVGSRMRRR